MNARPSASSQFVDELDRDDREIVDEIERVLDLVSDAGGQLAERGELLRLHQAILRGAQVFKRLGQLPGALLLGFEQSYIFNRDTGLVGEGINQRNLLLGEWTHGLTHQDHHTDGYAFAQQRHAEHRA